jgi:hypothetical protein
MAEGGIVTGPTDATIGEAGPEARLSLEHLGQGMAGVPYVSGSRAAEALTAKVKEIGTNIAGTMHGGLLDRGSAAAHGALNVLGLASPQVGVGVSDVLQQTGVHSAQADVAGGLTDAGLSMITPSPGSALSTAKTILKAGRTAEQLLNIGLKAGTQVAARAGAAYHNFGQLAQSALPVVEGQAARAGHAIMSAGGEALDALHAAAMRSGPAPGMAGTITIDHRNADTPVASFNPRALFRNKEVVRQTQMDKASQGPAPQAN